MTKRIETKDKSQEQLMVEVSHLYRSLMHEAPSIHFKEHYKGTHETPAKLKGRHDYTCEVGIFIATEKGHTFLAFRKGNGDSYMNALLNLIETINVEW